MFNSLNEVVKRFTKVASNNASRNTYCQYVNVEGSLAKKLTSIGATKHAPNSYILPNGLLAVRYKSTHQKGRYKVQLGFTQKGLLAVRGVKLLHNHGSDKLYVTSVEKLEDGDFRVTGTRDCEMTSKFFNKTSTKRKLVEGAEITLTAKQLKSRYVDIATF